MIERHWKGISKRDKADEYVAHLQDNTFKKIGAIDGFVSATILRRDVKEGVEFLIITRWRTLDAIKQFAGSAIEVAVVPALVQDMLIQYDSIVNHYETYYTTEEE